ncbi:MAG: hypothetical protein U1E42_09725 [Rhodospirillales bacterium]
MIGELRRGDDVPADLAKAFSALGISADAVRAADAPELLRMIADGLAAIPDEADRAAARTAIFGKIARELGPVLDGGRRQIDEFGASLEKMGGVADEALVRKAAEAKDKLEALNLVVERKLNITFAEYADTLLAVEEEKKNLIETGLKLLDVVTHLASAYGNLEAKADAGAKALYDLRKAQDEAAESARRMQAPDAKPSNLDFFPEGKKGATLDRGDGYMLASYGAGDLDTLSESQSRALDRWERRDSGEKSSSGDTVAPSGDGWSESTKGLVEWARTFEDVIPQLREAAQGMDELSRYTGEFGYIATNAFDQAITGGGKFKDIFTGIIKDIARVAMQRLIMNAVMKLASAFFGGFAGGYAGGAGDFSALAGATNTSVGGFGAFQTYSVGGFHSGGIVGHDTPMTRLGARVNWSAAPRFHEGLLPGEYPAILKKNEAVLTPAQMAAMGGTKVNVVVNNNTGAQVKAEDDGRGNVTIDINRIDQQLAGIIGRRGSASARAIDGLTSGKPRLIPR